MKIEWLTPPYSSVTSDSLQSLAAAGKQLSIDREAPLRANLTIGSFSGRVDTSGLATFYKAIKNFLDNIERGNRAVLIIDDDDAFHLRCELVKNIYSCSLRRGGLELATADDSAAHIANRVRDYVSFYETYLKESGLGSLARP